MIVIAALTLIISGGLFWISSYFFGDVGLGVCGGSVMEAGDECQNLRTGAVQSYSEVLEEERVVRDIFGWFVLVVGIGVIVVGAAGVRLAWKGDSLTSRVRRVFRTTGGRQA
jgi:hypothetical protein